MELEYVNKALRYINKPEITVNLISKTVFMSLLSTIVIGLSLPIRSICCTLWYNTLSSIKNSSEAKPKKQKRTKNNEVSEE